MKAIYKRELASYFNSMVGYLCIAALVVFIGIYFMAYNLFAGYPYFSFTLSASLFVFMVIVPLLTMRSLSEERHSRTDQLLLTSPATITEVVLGKYLAMVTVYLIPVAIAALCPLVIRLNGTAYLKADYAALFAFFLLGATQIAVGLLISALTESQVIAAVGTFGVLLGLYLWDGLLGYLPTSALSSFLGLLLGLMLLCFLLYSLSESRGLTLCVLVLGLAALLGAYFYDAQLFVGLLPKLLGSFSLIAAFDSFASLHVFDVPGAILYLSLTALLVFLTVQVVQKRRWS